MVATTVRRISAQVHLRGVIDVVLLEDLRTIASTEGAPERRIRGSTGQMFAVTCVKEEARVRCLGCACWLDEKQGVTVSVPAPTWTPPAIAYLTAREVHYKSICTTKNQTNTARAIESKSV